MGPQGAPTGPMGPPWGPKGPIIEKAFGHAAHPQQGAKGSQGAPWGPKGSLGGPLGPKGPLGPLGSLSRAPLGHLGPLGPCYGSRINSKPSQKINFWAFLGPIYDILWGPKGPPRAHGASMGPPWGPKGAATRGRQARDNQGAGLLVSWAPPGTAGPSSSPRGAQNV